MCPLVPGSCSSRCSCSRSSNDKVLANAQYLSRSCISQSGLGFRFERMGVQVRSGWLPALRSDSNPVCQLNANINTKANTQNTRHINQCRTWRRTGCGQIYKRFPALASVGQTNKLQFV